MMVVRAGRGKRCILGFRSFRIRHIRDLFGLGSLRTAMSRPSHCEGVDRREKATGETTPVATALPGSPHSLRQVLGPELPLQPSYGRYQRIMHALPIRVCRGPLFGAAISGGFRG